MVAVLVFAATLLVAVFLSELSQRSVLSTAVLFLFAGFIAAGTSMYRRYVWSAENRLLKGIATAIYDRKEFRSTLSLSPRKIRIRVRC
jgi:hypothetical protein